MPIHEHQAWDYRSPLVLVGFPSRGLVGAIAASYLVPRLDMEMVATMDSPHLPPVASVRGGRAVAPIQIFASTQQCGLDGNCDQLVVVRSDAAPPALHTHEIAREILGWAAEKGAALVVTLEGAPTDEPNVDRVFGVPNLRCEIDLASVGAEPFPDGALSGVSAALLTEGNKMDVGVFCLFTGVDAKKPDAAAAARLVGVSDVLVPGIVMDAQPLEEQAAEHERKLKASVDEQRRSMEDLPDNSRMMYG